MKWNVFVGRRNMDVPTWLSEASIKSYGALAAWCAEANVEPPPKDDVKGMFGPRAKTAVNANVSPPVAVEELPRPITADKPQPKNPRKVTKAAATDDKKPTEDKQATK